MRHQRNVGGGAREIEGFPMDFKEYTRDLLRPGPYKGIVLMQKEDKGSLRVVVGVTEGGDPSRGNLVQVEWKSKPGTTWWDDFIGAVDPNLPEGERIGNYRGMIVEVDVDQRTYYSERYNEDRTVNQIKTWLRARRPNTGGRGRDEGRRELVDRDRERGRGRRDERTDHRGTRGGVDPERRGMTYGDRDRDDRSRGRDDRSRSHERPADDRGRDDRGYGHNDDADLPF